MKKLFLILFLTCCVQLNAQTQAQMTKEASDDFHKADKELNKVYKELLNVLDAKEKALLIQAQKDWLKFRDSHCKFEAEEVEGGSMQPMINLTCLTDRTEDRIKDLKASIKSRLGK